MMKKQRIRRQRTLILCLLFLSVVAPIVFLADRLSRLPRSLDRKGFAEDVGGITRSMDALQLTQETEEGLKEPDRVVYSVGDDSTVNDTGNGSGVNAGGNKMPLQKILSFDGGKEQPDQTTGQEQHNGDLHSQAQQVDDVKIREMKDDLITARAYLSFAPPKSNSHLVKELKMRIKEIDRVVGLTNKDSKLSQIAMQRKRAMEATLAKASKIYPDCHAMSMRLRAMAYNTEEQLRSQVNEAYFLIQLAARTFPKGLHCLSMRLTSDYFNLQPGNQEFPNRHKVQQPDLYHYAIFSDNILACAVVVNSTVTNAMEPEKVVFHVVTDALNYPAMMMWFLTNPPGEATIEIKNMDDLKWLPSIFHSLLMQPVSRDPRYSSALNHLRFYLPQVFPSLNKILFLDHDVVVQRDLMKLWKVNMKGKVNGAVETCSADNSFHRLGTYVNFKEPSLAESFDPNACTWAFGMNMFDLRKWRQRKLMDIYHKWLQMGNRSLLMKEGTLPLGQLTFYNQTVALDRRWHVLGLGNDPTVERGAIERAPVVHYDGNMKPWLEIGIPKYKGYWNRFLNFNQPFLQQCNIHG
ncbi:putative galacturonosyltransferase 6 [Acorus gramineus]|uniref:Hexosyltransferase n=1 Tax=Acorus gramineus TaxID=55184 RepID=A0AAV9AJL5_ACOGR|nr:putative galacturonosyltransferase 6 [Acorus gramineus]